MSVVMVDSERDNLRTVVCRSFVKPAQRICSRETPSIPMLGLIFIGEHIIAQTFFWFGGYYVEIQNYLFDS